MSLAEEIINAGQRSRQLAMAEPGQQLGQLSALQGILMQAQQAPLKAALLQGQLKRQQSEQALTDQIGGGNGLDSLSPEQLTLIGQKMAIGNHPGAATVLKMAETKRLAAERPAQLDLLRGQPQGLPAGATVAGQQTTQAIPADEVAAFAKVAQAAQQGQTASATPAAGDPQLKGGGVFAGLAASESPAIAQRARYLQSMVDNPNFKGDPARIQQEVDNLTKMDAAFSQQKAQQAERLQASKDRAAEAAANRPERSDPLVSIVGPDGKPTLVPRSQAAGATPFQASMHGGTASGREAIFNDRIRLSANQATKDLENVTQLPLSASTGLLGGRKQGPGILDATKEVLANKMTGQDAQTYQAMATGFQRSLASIEAAGLMPSGSLTHQMDSVIFKEGDTNLTKLHKLAQTRQIVETGLENLATSDRVSPEIKSHVKDILARVQKAVPYTHSDLIKLSIAQEANPRMTLKQIMASEEKAAPAGDAGGWKVTPIQ